MKIKNFMIPLVLTVLMCPLLAQAGWKEVTFELCSYVIKSPGDGKAEDIKTFHIPQDHEYISYSCEETAKNGRNCGYECNYNPNTRSFNLRTWATRHEDSGCVIVWFGPRCWLGMKAKIKCRIWEDGIHTGTALHETGDNVAFCLAPNRDLFFILKSGTGTKSTEVHVLSAASDYKQFICQTGTALHETDGKFAFCLAPNRDLFCISKRDTGTHSTEVHVLSADSQYQTFSLHTGTALSETGDNVAFCLAPNRDLFFIVKSGTGTNSTEVHVLSAASNYQQFSMQTSTALHETGEDFEFCLTENKDLFAIKRRGTGTNTTEIHTFPLEFPEEGPAAERERQRKENGEIEIAARKAREREEREAQEANEREAQRTREEVDRERARLQEQFDELLKTIENLHGQELWKHKQIIRAFCERLGIPVPPEYQSQDGAQAGAGGGV